MISLPGVLNQAKGRMPPPQNLWVSSGCFGRPAPEPRIFKASLRCPMDLARMPKDRYARGAWRNGVGLCGDATWQGIFRPMVRRRCIRPRLADGVRGGFVLRHRTPESCLKIPLPSGIFGVKHARAFCTSNCRASDLFRKALYIKMLRAQLPCGSPTNSTDEPSTLVLREFFELFRVASGRAVHHLSKSVERVSFHRRTMQPLCRWPGRGDRARCRCGRTRSRSSRRSS